MHTLVLKVSGMHCGACASRVERALRGVPGVVQAAVEVATATATVTLDDPPAMHVQARDQAFCQHRASDKCEYRVLSAEC